MVALLYPFSWQHTFIPVLPASMIDIVCCPTPFLVGLLSSSLPTLKELPVEEVGHLGSPLGGGWDRGTEAPGREGQKGKGLGEAAGIFLFVSPALLLAPWEASPWLEFFLLSDPGNPGYLCRALQGFIS